MTGGNPRSRREISPDALESRWTAPDGHAIRRIDWPAPEAAPRGSILFMPGRGDAYEKYLETLDDWHGQGWGVTAFDWRGQGGSGRFGADGVTGHIADFGLWVDDLAAAWRQWCETTPGPHVLAGHSMGGHLVLRALAQGKVDPDAVVLVAPMLGLLPQWLPSSLAQLVARVMIRLGDPRRPAWKWSEKPGALPDERWRLLTHDQGRYSDEEWWREVRPQIAMGPGSWGWVERALASIRLLERPGILEAVDRPVLILATRGDALVSFRAISKAARRLPHARLVTWGSEARHEILREADGVRGEALAAIGAFLDEAAPRQK